MERQIRMNISEEECKLMLSFAIIKDRDSPNHHLLQKQKQKILKMNLNHTMFKQEINEAKSLNETIITSICGDLESIELIHMAEKLEQVRKLYDAIIKIFVQKLNYEQSTNKKNGQKDSADCTLCKHHKEKEKIQKIKISITRDNPWKILTADIEGMISQPRQDSRLEAQIQRSLSRKRLSEKIKPTNLPEYLESIFKNRQTFSVSPNYDRQYNKAMQFLKNSSDLCQQIFKQMKETYSTLKLQKIVPCLVNLMHFYHQHCTKLEKKGIKIEVGCQTWQTMAELANDDKIRDLKEGIELKKQIIQLLETDLRQAKKQIKLLKEKEVGLLEKFFAGPNFAVVPVKSQANHTSYKQINQFQQVSSEKKQQNIENSFPIKGSQNSSKHKKLVKKENVNFNRENKSNGFSKSKPARDSTQQEKNQDIPLKNQIVNSKIRKSRFSRFSSESQSTTKGSLLSTTAPNKHFAKTSVNPSRFSTFQVSSLVQKSPSVSSNERSSQPSMLIAQSILKSSVNYISELPTVQEHEPAIKISTRESSLRNSMSMPITNKARKTAFSVMFSKNQLGRESMDTSVKWRIKHKKVIYATNQNVQFDKQDMGSSLFLRKHQIRSTISELQQIVHNRGRITCFVQSHQILTNIRSSNLRQFCKFYTLSLPYFNWWIEENPKESTVRSKKSQSCTKDAQKVANFAAIYKDFSLKLDFKQIFHDNFQYLELDNYFLNIN